MSSYDWLADETKYNGLSKEDWLKQQANMGLTHYTGPTPEAAEAAMRKAQEAKEVIACSLPFPTTPEQAEVLGYFALMLTSVSKDGGRKRAAGLKPSWKIDKSHVPAMFSHLNKWFHGERADKDSGVHPLIHLAWRALAVAWQESNPNPTVQP